MSTLEKIVSLSALCALLAGPMQAALSEDLDAKAAAMIKSDFHARGIATMDRLNQDEVQAACSKYGDKIPEKIADRLRSEQLAGIRYPADGKYLGDWRKGEALAQDGRGKTWSDKADAPAGGNCYNCHQLSGDELAYGTIGPSLRQYGKRVGNTPDTQRFVWGKIFNAKAFNLCSAMPRFGHAQALTEDQIRDLAALLLDPESPVNR